MSWNARILREAYQRLAPYGKEIRGLIGCRVNARVQVTDSEVAEGIGWVRSLKYDRAPDRFKCLVEFEKVLISGGSIWRLWVLVEQVAVLEDLTGDHPTGEQEGEEG